MTNKIGIVGGELTPLIRRFVGAVGPSPKRLQCANCHETGKGQKSAAGAVGSPRCYGDGLRALFVSTTFPSSAVALTTSDISAGPFCSWDERTDSVLSLEASTPPITTVASLSNRARVSGTQTLARCHRHSGAHASHVPADRGQPELQVIATATSTDVGWLTLWNSTTVPNGTYTFQSVPRTHAASSRRAAASRSR